ncbi:sensor histidine kinase [Curvibacter sp. PAE-UM]|uniref:sensor histidine kinase n=1 Tax=Curvibacter sp. PAE-UM TaxID=1714344 RepID=UPI00070DA26D|nr:sensor histidine kinase [Curvibacter sp. PAE-UM]KRH99568.1 histidine kinase [Curvibacter sp. PAE-UM]
MNAAPAAWQARASLRTRLVRNVLLPLALTWLLGTAVTVAVAYHFAQKAFDRALQDDAFALASRVRLQPQGLALELSAQEANALLFDQSENIYFVVRRLDGAVIAGNPDLDLPSPHKVEDAEFSELNFGQERLRAVTFWREQPFAFQVIVAQTMGSRRALLHDLLFFSVAPLLLLLVLLALWLRGIIGDELQPLSELQRSVEQRDALDLTPVPVSASSRELQQLGTAVNALLVRLSQSMQAQREFSGNVAHELRTPLAGIRALAEYGLTQPDPAAWREQLQRIAASEARASHLVDQLLALALAEEADVGVQNEPVALDEVVRATVLRYLSRADAAGVDLGVQGLDEPVQVAGNVALIEGILGNLLDNALRYGRAPAGQASTLTVELAREGDRVRLSVIDNGPGLTPQERQHLMQRGVRGLHADRLGQGAGLGLAIVAKFAQLMQAHFELSNASAGSGLCASVNFQAPPRS